MPTSITIRNVPDEAHAELVSRAALKGQSLQEFLRSQLIALSRRADVETVLARARQRVEAEGSSLSAERILELRDLGRAERGERILELLGLRRDDRDDIGR